MNELDSISSNSISGIIAGISMGGWMTTSLGERELPSIAGMVILLAGRPMHAKPLPPGTSLRNIPVYIGAGETDPNMMPARKAREFYKRNGALCAHHRRSLPPSFGWKTG